MKLEIKTSKIEDLKEYSGNAKIHTPEQIQDIANSISEFGFNDPIAIDEKNEIIEGHGRLQALKQLFSDESKEIQVIRLNGLTEPAKKAYRIAHNKLGMLTDFDFNLLKDEENCTN